MHPIATASIGIPDTLFLMVLALVVFGPRRLPEIGRQIGKLMYEFRRVSNDFKYQMEEELRAAEEADRQRKLAATISMPPLPEATTATATEPAAAPEYVEQTTQTESVPDSAEAALLPSERNRLSAQMVEVPYNPPQATLEAPADDTAVNAATPETLAVKPPSQGEAVPAARPFRSASTPQPDSSPASANTSEAAHG